MNLNCETPLAASVDEAGTDLPSDNGSSAVLSKADLYRAYIRAGLSLVPVPHGRKGPNSKGWHLPNNCISDEASINRLTGNVGLAHAYSSPHTFSLDIDQLDKAAAWLDERSVNLQDLLDAQNAVQIVSGKPNRSKLLYALPAGAQPLRTRQVPDADGSMILEFRCATAEGHTAQDLLPPSIHPDTHKEYRWGGAGSFRAIPEAPAALISVWEGITQSRNRRTSTAGATASPPAIYAKPVIDSVTAAIAGCEDFAFTETNQQRLQQAVEVHLAGLAGGVGYDEWFKRACEFKSLVSEGWPEEFVYCSFDEFSKRAGGNYDQANNLKCWNSIKAVGRGIRTWRSLLRGVSSEPLLVSAPINATQVVNQLNSPAAPAVITSVALRVRRGLPYPDEENVRIILEGDPALTGVIAFNEFSNERVLCRPIPDGRCGSVVMARGLPRPWQDSDTVALQTYIQRHHIPGMPLTRVESAVNLYAKERCAVHPVRDYLQGLAWDGVERLPTWTQLYLGASVQPVAYLEAVGTKFLIGAVARIFQPGCKVDSALVVVGVQGIGKSSAARVLAGDEYFSDSLPADLASKDAKDHLNGKWIVELPELSQFRRSDIETVKAFMSRQAERFRPAYGRHEVTIPRQCAFFGTTNEESFLVDQTGNRRFWPITCSQIDLAALKRDRDQLWAEATVRYRRGEQWHLTEAEAALAAGEAAERIITDPWARLVHRAVMQSVFSDQYRETMSPGEVMGAMDLDKRDQHSGASNRIAKILVEQGWTRGKKDGVRGRLYNRPLAGPHAHAS